MNKSHEAYSMDSVGISVMATIDMYIQRFRQSYLRGDYEEAANYLLAAHACMPTKTTKQQKVKEVS